MASQLVVPKFASETEEADWWFNNRHLVEQEFSEAFRDGSARRVSLQQVLAERRAKLHAKAQVELEGEDAEKAHLAAKKRGMAVEPYLRMLVHEALEKETAA